MAFTGTARDALLGAAADLMPIRGSVGMDAGAEVKDGKGSDKGWGRLKSGAGWIALDFCQRV